LATQNGITVTLSQGSVSGNRGLQIGVQSAKVTNAVNADKATDATNLVTNPSNSTIYISGPNSSAGVTPKSIFTAENVFVTGGNTINALTFNSTSDERLKENIENVGHNQIKNIVEKVDVKTFNFKKLKDKTFIGVVAQDLLNSNTVIGDLLVDKNEDGFLSIKESKLVYVLWDYIKQLEERVKKLEEK
jgi:hypothetical protein